MKKIIAPLALVSAMSFAQTALSQSNVTTYGLIDMGVGRTVETGKTGVHQGLASRIGFKGQEDLGGGWKASFHLQHRFNADTGASSNPSKFWHADSWVGLENSFGQIRLGRMFTPAYEYAMLPADPFMHSWSSSSIRTLTGAISPYRFDNGINYNMKSGGFRFGVTFAPSEGVVNTKNAYSAAASYTTGKLYMAVGHENQGSQHDAWNSVTARWGDDSLKVFGFYGFGRNAENQTIRSYSAGASGRVANGVLMASYSRMNNHELNTRVQDKFSVGYHYMLSKRTRLYSNLGHDRAVQSNNTGFDVGVSHSF